MSDGASTTGLAGLTVDLDLLRDSGGALREIAIVFNTDDALLHIALEGVGEFSGAGAGIQHHGSESLRRALEDFSHTWRVRRDKVKGQVSYLATSVLEIADRLDAVDAHLARFVVPAPAIGGTGPVRSGVGDTR